MADMKKIENRNWKLEIRPLTAAMAVVLFCVAASAAERTGPAFGPVLQIEYRKPAAHFVGDDSLVWFPHIAKSFPWRPENTIAENKYVERQAGGLVMKVREALMPGAKPPGGVWFTLFRPVHGQGHIGWGRIEPCPICFGSVRPVPMLPGEHFFAGEQTAWGANKLTFAYTRPLLGGDEEEAGFSVTAGRLTPGIMVESDSDMLVFFSEAPQTPRHLAWRAGGGLAQHTFNEGEVMAMRKSEWEHSVRKDALEDIFDPGYYNEVELEPTAWLLAWFGEKGRYFYASRDARWLYDFYHRAGSGEGHPIGIEAGQRDLTAPADMPFLFVFQNPPSSLCLVEGGGIRFTFKDQAGKVAMLPLFGEDVPGAGEGTGWQAGLTENTRSWAAKLPDAIREKCEIWAARLRQFPVDVVETAKYDAASDELSLAYNFKFEPVGEGGVKFAPVPPMLAMAAKMGFPARLPECVDTGYLTQVGPYVGVENADGYEIKMSGLGKYVAQARAAGDGAGPACEKLAAQLAREVEKMSAAGRLAPGLYHSSVTTWGQFAGGLSFVWDRPGETVRRLAEALDFLPDSAKDKALAYMKDEQAARPAETTLAVGIRDGARREPYRLDTRMPTFGIEKVSDYKQDIMELADYLADYNDYYRKEKLLPPDALYSLAEYARRVPGAAIDWQAARAAMDAHDRRRDWATLGFVKRSPSLSMMRQGNGRDASGIARANTYLAGCIGLARLAMVHGDGAALNDAYARFYLAAAHRYALDEYVQWLYSAGLFKLPENQPPDWLLKSFSGAWTRWHSFVKEYSPAIDSRQIENVDEMGVVIGRGSGQVPTAGAAVPEAGRLLNDLLGDKLRAKAAAAYEPAEWFVWNCGGYYVKKPLDNSNYLFHAWIAGAKPEQMAVWTGAPWAVAGDFCYIQRLVEALYACRGVEWREWKK